MWAVENVPWEPPPGGTGALVVRCTLLALDEVGALLLAAPVLLSRLPSRIPYPVCLQTLPHRSLLLGPSPHEGLPGVHSAFRRHPQDGKAPTIQRKEALLVGCLLGASGAAARAQVVEFLSLGPRYAWSPGAPLPRPPL